MLTAISNFISTVPSERFIPEVPGEGLHILIRLNDSGNFLSSESHIQLKKDQVLSDLISEFSRRAYLSELIAMNKAVDIGGENHKKIHSSTPYALKFKFKKPTKVSDTEWKKKDLKSIFNETIKSRFKKYYSNLREINKDSQVIGDHINFIKSYCNKELFEVLVNELGGHELIEKKADRVFIKSEKNEIDFYITVYFSIRDSELLEKAYDNYLHQFVFNKKDKGKNYGQSIFLNGKPDKKPFVYPNTTHYLNNVVVDKETAFRLIKFTQLAKNKQLPNPLPIFIENKELNEKMVTLYNREGVVRFRDILKTLYEYREGDLTNYYLIYWKFGRKMKISDVDFVPRFTYKLPGFVVKNVIGINKFDGYSLDNIFAFESKFLSLVFNNSLVAEGKERLILNYFGDLDKSKMSSVTYQNVITYRKNFYDYIYKSLTQAVTGQIFNNLMTSSILDDVKHDENHTNYWKIIHKLNVWFSLNKHFDSTNKNFLGVYMTSQIPQYQEQIKMIITDGNQHIMDDGMFGYAAGQLIYYLIFQSKTEKKTHAMIEPYISKNDPEIFKNAIIRGINQYKHALRFNSKKVNKLISEVLGYQCNVRINDLLPFILAGYFSSCVLLKKEDE